MRKNKKKENTDTKAKRIIVNVVLDFVLCGDTGKRTEKKKINKSQ